MPKSGREVFGSSPNRERKEVIRLTRVVIFVGTAEIGEDAVEKAEAAANEWLAEHAEAEIVSVHPTHVALPASAENEDEHTYSLCVAYR